MASFSAELHVGGQVFRLRQCTYQTEQATDARGRTVAKVRFGPVALVLDVPEGDALLAWAASPHKRQAADIVFRSVMGGSPLETLRLSGAYCVAYAEEFVHGDATAGAYVAHLTLSDPGGFTLLPGGPAAGFVAPAAREYAYVAPAVAGSSAVAGRPFLKNEADPVRDILGSGRESHPQEWEATLAMLRREGVEVTYRPGVMSYWAVEGQAGRMLLDPDASIAALRHETQHYLDDKALGHPGMGHYFEDSAARWQLEYNAYMKEIAFVRELREFPTGKQLVTLARQEKATIFGSAIL
ncbi:MAG TPA: type VI secretion system tube protein TssD [Hymenobacter sp.]|uniref:type VI secretion system tube protein TssD n=1 Tax=Hymenobacter sp. TaxID=1898978 RepID=UPI002D7F8F5E|nr:type VI secretion system tube protein TssD [Hymenobacter sp.]HET9501896.1 type VI secretion system tube protein TssD [Hymenobacter sp.]